MKTIRHLLLAATLAATAGIAHADGRRDVPPPVPSTELLATVPGLTATQQQEIRRIEIDKRDALEALRIKQRNEFERIDAQADERIRKLLGEDGYRRFAEWKRDNARGPLARGPQTRGAAPAGAGKRRDAAPSSPPAPPVSG